MISADLSHFAGLVVDVNYVWLVVLLVFEVLNHNLVLVMGFIAS